MAQDALQPLRLQPLPLGSVRPAGWLQKQLTIQADGISGHLHEFWPDVRDSQWFGGNAEAWERAPYWLDGVIPLAVLIDRPELKRRVFAYVDTILERQHPDGWLGPRTMIASSGQQAQPHYDLWGQILATKVLLQAHDATGDDRIVTALMQALRCMDTHIDTAPLFNWGQFRWFEALLSIFWLFERTGDPWLIDLAVKLHAQGFNWRAFFEARHGWPAAQPTPKGRWNFMSHVVNNAMAPKAPALWWRLTGDEGDRRAAYGFIEKLERHHGMATAMFTGDECLAGRQPTHGTELCAVVEYAFSLETLLALLGDPCFADRLEQVVFNALPATFSPDMWSHQYDQQANQVLCSSRDDHIWNTNGPDANLFGVEPNYGCCTANLSQGWPKFAAHLWMSRPQDGGLVAVAYAPSRVDTTVKDVPVTIVLETEYPFSDRLRFLVSAERPVAFPLSLRIPGWADGATIQVPDGTTTGVQPGAFCDVDRTWHGTSEVSLVLPMAPELWHGYKDAIAIRRGPLVYALSLGERWERVHENAPYRELPHADWEVYPTTPWAYALDVNEATLGSDVRFVEHPVGDMPFSPEGAPVTAYVTGRRLHTWDLRNGSADDVPESPVRSDAPPETLSLIPYGCTNLRITEFPTLERETSS